MARAVRLFILVALGALLAAPAAEIGRAGADAPRLAIIIDDLGYDRASAEALAAVPVPLTVSVLPYLPHSTDAAEEAHRQGRQVLLHVPMESTSGIRHEAIGLRSGMSPGEVDALVAAMLATVPYAVGVSNHQGSRVTAEREVMDALMSALHARGLFFIDSRTTAATVALAAAESSGVPAAARKVFLDNVLERRAVLAQLDLAAREARRLGAAVAIGHPHRATITALGEQARRLEAQGIRFVLAAEVVR